MPSGFVGFGLVWFFVRPVFLCFLCQKGKMNLIYIIYILKSQWSENKAVNIKLLTWLFGILIGALQMLSKDQHSGNLAENFIAESVSNWYVNTNVWIYESRNRLKSSLLRWILRREELLRSTWKYLSTSIWILDSYYVSNLSIMPLKNKSC